MLLKNLIRNIPKNKKNIVISGLSINSNETKKNHIFFAIKGNKINGERFIKSAIYKGAVVIVCSKRCKISNKKIHVIKTNNIRELLSLTASKYYNLKPKNIIAVTGTNGKTSVADYFYQLLTMNKIPAATIGTLGIKYNGKIIKTKLTSPDTLTLHRYLHFLKRKKIDNVIIEASSHGLEQKRLHNINFKAAIFTNFSQDHLDYHKTMKSYLDAKLILFKKILKNNSKIISDKDSKIFSLIKKIAIKKNLQLLEIDKEYKKIKNFIDPIGDFKIKNLAMAIEAAKICGLKSKLIYQKVNKLKDVSGRLEYVKGFKNGIKIFIDYAHTPDALYKSLQSLRNKYGDNITLVFGCGGERDRKKRPMMAKIANKNCKKIYITDDNPRNENPKKIRNDISKHIAKNKSSIIGNRLLAIKKSIIEASPQEVILIAGKGHEEYQIYKNKVINISDKKIVKKIKIKKKFFTKKDRNFFLNNLLLNKILKQNKKTYFNGLSIDSRTLKKDNLFLTLKGKKNDGANFINSALKKRAKCIISSSDTRKNHKKITKVKNPTSFLKNFAKLKRDYSLAKIIAVTGSTGKTSLKNLLKDLLSKFGKTYSSPMSFNNHLGVPISLSNLSIEDKFGIFEVGMSRAGEIRNLTRLIRPHIGVITNIGEAHIENFKNISGIAEAKSEIIEQIIPGGTIILNRDDKYFNYLFQKAKLNKLKILTFGVHEKADVRIQKINMKKDFSKIYIKIKNEIIDVKIRDINVYNVLASITVLKELKLRLSKIKAKLKILTSPEGRGKKHSIFRYKKKFKLIDESYNANPSSVKNAVNKFSMIKKENFKKYLILGDMLELGSKSKKYHEEVSKVINNSDIDKVFIKGKKTIFTYKQLNKNKRGNILQNNEDIDIILSEMISNNDYLMIKGSNATGLNYFSKRMIKGI